VLEALDPPDRVDARVRPDLAFALRGSRDPEVDRRLAALDADDPQGAVRARAGFVLGEHGERFDPVLLERARSVARADLAGDDPDVAALSARLASVTVTDGHGHGATEHGARSTAQGRSTDSCLRCHGPRAAGAGRQGVSRVP